jgi:HEPN domain-containing protein
LGQTKYNYDHNELLSNADSSLESAKDDFLAARYEKCVEASHLAIEFALKSVYFCFNPNGSNASVWGHDLTKILVAKSQSVKDIFGKKYKVLTQEIRTTASVGNAWKPGDRYRRFGGQEFASRYLQTAKKVIKCVKAIKK